MVDSIHDELLALNCREQSLNTVFYLNWLRFYRCHSYEGIDTLATLPFLYLNLLLM